MLSARPMMYYGSCVGFYVGQGMDISVDYFIAKYLDDNAGVASGGSKSDNTPPKIILTEPKLPNADKKISLTNSSVLVTGNVKDDNSVYKLMVNDTEVPVDERGNFSTFLPLEEGDNNFTIIATDGFMNDARNVFTVTRKPGVSRGNAPLKTGTKASAETPGKYYALFIGVQNYKDPQINQLDRPVEDAGSLAEVLTSNYSFDPKNIMLLKNPNRIDLFKAFDSLQKKVTRNDNLLIFYAGHGLWIENMKQGYWLPADAGKTDKSTWMSNADIKNYITSISSKHTLLITDACFSGGIFKTRAVLPDADKAMNEYIKTPSRKAITSGTLTEVPDNSVFIEYLVKSLKTNSEKYITALELFNRFNRNVINNSPSASQIPQYGVISEAGDEGGEFIFIKNKQ